MIRVVVIQELIVHFSRLKEVYNLMLIFDQPFFIDIRKSTIRFYIKIHDSYMDSYIQIIMHHTPA